MEDLPLRETACTRSATPDVFLRSRTSGEAYTLGTILALMLRTALPLLLVFCGSVFAADLTGDYTGTYTTADGNEGKVHLVLKKNADATWGCQFTFTTDSGDVAPKTISCAVTDNKLSAEYEADVDGNTIHVTTEGTASAGTLEGTYQAKSPAGESVDQGKWKASLKT